MPFPPFKKTYLCTILSPVFLIFQSLRALEEVIKIYSPPLKKRGGGRGGGANYETGCTFDVFDVVELNSKQAPFRSILQM